MILKKSIVLVSVTLIILLWHLGNAVATSPQPEEVRPGPTTTVCTTHIIYTADIEKGRAQHEAYVTHNFDESIPKKEVTEKMTTYINNKLKEWNVSEFKLECKFPKVK